MSIPVGAPAAAPTVQGTVITPPASWGEFSTSFNLTSRAGRATASIPKEERARPISADFSTLGKVAILLGGEGFQVAERGLSGTNPAQFPGTTRQYLTIEVRREQRHAYLPERERDRDWRACE